MLSIHNLASTTQEVDILHTKTDDGFSALLSFQCSCSYFSKFFLIVQAFRTFLTGERAITYRYFCSGHDG